VSQTLSGAIEATQARLARGIAEAEEELARARARCRELRQQLALERARASAAVTEAPPKPEPAVRALEQRARIAELTTTYLSTTAARRPIPKRWMPALMTILRLDVDRFGRAFARNTVLYWSGSGPTEGLHLGNAKAVEIASIIARRIEPGSIAVEELTEADDNLDVVARVTFVHPSGSPPLETTIHSVFRFDDNGRIALLYATPYEGDAIAPYLS
jgi:ketosteroid isomerase-like protein